MSNFLQLPSELRERIINTFDWKSYFRMQQTCRDMADFYQTNPVKISLPDTFWIYIKIDQNGHQYFFSQKKITRKRRRKSTVHGGFTILQKTPEFESLFGVRFSNIMIAQEQFVPAGKEFLTEFGNIMKKYRITSKILDSIQVAMGFNDEFQELLVVLDPVEIKMDSRGSDLFKTLLKKEANLFIRIEDMPDPEIIKDLLLHIPTLYVHMDTDVEFIKCTDIIRNILQQLREPLPNLCSFEFTAPHTDNHSHRLLPSADGLLGIFDDFNPMFLRRRGNSFNYSFKCHFIPGPRYCKVIADFLRVKIEFNYTMISRIRKR